MPVHKRTFFDAKLLTESTDAEENGKKYQHQDDEPAEEVDVALDGNLIHIGDEVKKNLRKHHEADEQQDDKQEDRLDDGGHDAEAENLGLLGSWGLLGRTFGLGFHSGIPPKFLV